MNTDIQRLLDKAQKTRSTLTSKTGYTLPRTWGTYELSASGQTRRFRYGNHPVRMTELIHEFGACKVVATFYSQDEARALAQLLNSAPSTK